MKTTVEIADPILREARKVAEREGTTLRALIDEGLRRVLAEKRSSKAFRLRLVTAGGRGLRPELRNASWDSRPLHHRRHRRQDRVDVAAGLQAEDRAAVVEQVELDIAAAPHQLLVAVGSPPAVAMLRRTSSG
jgi:hypothetical protein